MHESSGIVRLELRIGLYQDPAFGECWVRPPAGPLRTGTAGSSRIESFPDRHHEGSIPYYKIPYYSILYYKMPCYRISYAIRHEVGSKYEHKDSGFLYRELMILVWVKYSFFLDLDL